MNLTETTALLNRAIDELAQSNVSAKLQRMNHAHETVVAWLKDFGVANVAQIVADAVEEIALERTNVPDYDEAHKHLRKASEAVDLTYAEVNDGDSPDVADAKQRLKAGLGTFGDYDKVMGWK